MTHLYECSVISNTLMTNTPRSDLMRNAQPKEPCRIITTAASLFAAMLEEKYRCNNLKILASYESFRSNTKGDENRNDLDPL